MQYDPFIRGALLFTGLIAFTACAGSDPSSFPDTAVAFENAHVVIGDGSALEGAVVVVDGGLSLL